MSKKQITSDQTLGLAGAVIWAATVLLRETSLMNIDLCRLLLGVTPNFGAVWAANYLIPTTYGYIRKKPFPEERQSALLILILLLLLASEIIHHFFLSAPFDVWDMAASLAAAGILAAVHRTQTNPNTTK